MHLVLRTTNNSEYSGRVSGVVVNMTAELRKRIRKLRYWQRKTGAGLTVQNDEPTWVDDLETEEPLTEMHDSWDPNDHEVSQVEFLSEAFLHVDAAGFWWTCADTEGSVTYTTPCVPFKYVEQRPKRKSLQEIYDACRKLWDQEIAVKREVTHAFAEIIRPWLARHPTAEWVQVSFGESDQEGQKVWGVVSDSIGHHGEWQRKEDDLYDELTLYPVFDYAFDPGDFVRVTKDKIYVKKGWKARCQ